MSENFCKQFDYLEAPQSAGLLGHLGKTTHVECPACKGEKEVFAFMNTGDDHRKHRQEMAPCMTCNGAGNITASRAYWIDKGRQMRDARVARGETLKDASDSIGLTPAELSAIENGRFPSVCIQSKGGKS